MINNKFVTSFSELYLGASIASGGIVETAVNTWFTAPSGGSEATATTIADDAVIYLVSTTGVDDFRVYFKNTTGASITLVSADLSVKGLLDKGFVLEFAKVPLLSEIGSLSNEATVIDVPEFGERFKGKLRGQLDGGQLDTTLYWAPRETAHLLIRELATSGGAIGAGIRWLPDDGATTKGELVVFNSFVSSFGIDTAFDDVAKVSATLVVDGAESFAKET
jgi:hypothetical protein